MFSDLVGSQWEQKGLAAKSSRRWISKGVPREHCEFMTTYFFYQRTVSDTPAPETREYR
jgi:hypothetical protein